MLLSFTYLHLFQYIQHGKTLNIQLNINMQFCKFCQIFHDIVRQKPLAGNDRKPKPKSPSLTDIMSIREGD